MNPNSLYMLVNYWKGINRLLAFRLRLQLFGFGRRRSQRESGVGGAAHAVAAPAQPAGRPAARRQSAVGWRDALPGDAAHRRRSDPAHQLRRVPAGRARSESGRLGASGAGRHWSLRRLRHRRPAAGLPRRRHRRHGLRPHHVARHLAALQHGPSVRPSIFLSFSLKHAVLGAV